MNLKIIGNGPLFALREVAPVAHPSEPHPEAYCQAVVGGPTQLVEICGEELLESGACPKGHT